MFMGYVMRVSSSESRNQHENFGQMPVSGLWAGKTASEPLDLAELAVGAFTGGPFLRRAGRVFSPA